MTPENHSHELARCSLWENYAIAELLECGKLREAAAEVIRVNGQRVRRYLRTQLRDPDDADEAFSFFAEWTWRGIGSFRKEGTVEAWALGVARNAARRVREAQRRHATLADGDISRRVLEREDHREEDVDDLAHVRGLWLDSVRAGLPDVDRTLLALRLDRRLRWNAIAAVLGSRGSKASAAALRKRFSRITGRVRELARESTRPFV